MPLYEFVCEDCGHRFEILLKMSESDTLPICPKCKSPNTKKAISGFGIKGSSTGNGCGNFG